LLGQEISFSTRKAMWSVRRTSLRMGGRPEKNRIGSSRGGKDLVALKGGSKNTLSGKNVRGKAKGIREVRLGPERGISKRDELRSTNTVLAGSLSRTGGSVSDKEKALERRYVGTSRFLASGGRLARHFKRKEDVPGRSLHQTT